MRRHMSVDTTCSEVNITPSHAENHVFRKEFGLPVVMNILLNLMHSRIFKMAAKMNFFRLAKLYNSSLFSRLIPKQKLLAASLVSLNIIIFYSVVLSWKFLLINNWTIFYIFVSVVVLVGNRRILYLFITSFIKFVLCQMVKLSSKFNILYLRSASSRLIKIYK